MKKIKKYLLILIFIIIIVFFIIIFVDMYNVNKLNKKIKEENGAWIARKTPSNLKKIDLYFQDEDEEEDYDNDSPIFTTIYDFVSEDYNYDDLIPSKINKNKNTGLFYLSSLSSNLMFRKPTFYYEDKINWEKYVTMGKNQKKCGSCSAFSVLGGIEAYANRKYNFQENKLDLSEQYLISYINFSGCYGTSKLYYLNYLSLANKKKDENIENYLIKKIKEELKYVPEKIIITSNDLKKRTQISLFIEEVPFGVPLENELKYKFYDSCEINEFDQKNKKTNTNMIIEPLLDKKYNISLKNFDENFCPDKKDLKNTVFVPVKNDNFIKYFINSHFKINNVKCKENKKKIIEDIKESLKISPLIATIKTYETIKNYEEGVYSPLIDDYNTGMHGIIIIGWGIEKERNKEYWIIKNSWGDHWGTNGIIRTWIDDSNLNIECKSIYGFSGNLIEKTGKEINDLLLIAKEELEKEKLYEEKNKIKLNNLINKLENNQLENNIEYTEDNKLILIDILIQEMSIDEMSIDDINTKECNNEMNCITNKLQTFYD